MQRRRSRVSARSHREVRREPAGPRASAKRLARQSLVSTEPAWQPKPGPAAVAPRRPAGRGRVGPGSPDPDPRPASRRTIPRPGPTVPASRPPVGSRRTSRVRCRREEGRYTLRPRFRWPLRPRFRWPPCFRGGSGPGAGVRRGAGPAQRGALRGETAGDHLLPVDGHGRRLSSLRGAHPLWGRRLAGVRGIPFRPFLFFRRLDHVSVVPRPRDAGITLALPFGSSGPSSEDRPPHPRRSILALWYTVSSHRNRKRPGSRGRPAAALYRPRIFLSLFVDICWSPGYKDWCLKRHPRITILLLTAGRIERRAADGGPAVVLLQSGWTCPPSSSHVRAAKCAMSSGPHERGRDRPRGRRQGVEDTGRARGDGLAITFSSPLFSNLFLLSWTAARGALAADPVDDVPIRGRFRIEGERTARDRGRAPRGGSETTDLSMHARRGRVRLNGD